MLYGPAGEVYWNSMTGGHPGAWAAVQGDCNFVLYVGSVPIWYTASLCH